VQQTVERLAREIVEQKLSVYPSAAGRTHENDVRPIIDISNRVGIPIEADLFIGSSPIRQFAEEWDIDWIIEQSVKAVRFATENGIPVMYVTEDTTRAKPEDVEKLYTAAIEAGAKRICVCDTVGHATPWGARNLIRFVVALRDRLNPGVKVDWHGHSDRGLGVINSIAALEAGADRVHGSAAGIGERVGNTPMDLLMVNLKLMEWIDNDLTQLGEYVRFVSNAVKIALPDQYPVFGRDAFRTGTGVHAAAIIKAKKKGSEWLADRVYSGVPAGMFGLEQVIEVGPMSGLSNVIYWLASHGYPQEESLAKELFHLAKSTNRVLTDEELHSCAARWQERAAS
jgi:isopropylmalate/homocitrate/citramalate synthase